MLVAIALYALRPEPLLIGPRLVVPVLELALFVPLHRGTSLLLGAAQVWLTNVLVFALGLLGAGPGRAVVRSPRSCSRSSSSHEASAC